ncbi:hypothetical protein EJ08DRAFT_657548 [Tothia fuscella]|uniref:Uncharacterized protein n=1 Tax=Tothia fuscella TaxID=1048955 RepID=A0A9P4NYZ7_9PEZI|nr:hypothetical protein EJ08DRAFT_657548 [Tothia fuscella]
MENAINTARNAIRGKLYGVISKLGYAPPNLDPSPLSIHPANTKIGYTLQDEIDGIQSSIEQFIKAIDQLKESNNDSQTDEELERNEAMLRTLQTKQTELLTLQTWLTDQLPKLRLSFEELTQTMKIGSVAAKLARLNVAPPPHAGQLCQYRVAGVDLRLDVQLSVASKGAVCDDRETLVVPETEEEGVLGGSAINLILPVLAQRAVGNPTRSKHLLITDEEADRYFADFIETTAVKKGKNVVFTAKERQDLLDSVKKHIKHYNKGIKKANDWNKWLENYRAARAEMEEEDGVESVVSSTEFCQWEFKGKSFLLMKQHEAEENLRNTLDEARRYDGVSSGGNWMVTSVAKVPPWIEGPYIKDHHFSWTSRDAQAQIWDTDMKKVKCWVEEPMDNVEKNMKP